MKSKCILAVAQAIGRSLSEVEIRELETRLVTSLKELELRDPEGWAAKPIHARLQDAAKQAGDELIASKMLKQYRESLTVLKESQIQQHYRDFEALGVDKVEALSRYLAFEARTKGSTQSVETTIDAITADSVSQMLDALELTAPEWFGLVANREGAGHITRELFGEDSGNPVAKKGAEQVRRVFDALRERFNRNGGAIAKREDYSLPHHHSQHRVAAAGLDQWLADLTTPGFTRPGKPAIVKRANYRNANGTLMNDAQIKSFLRAEGKGIISGGADLYDASNPQGTGLVANRGSESRNIHFNDAEDYIAYQDKYGEKPLFDVLVGHTKSLARDIGLVEALSPNPDNFYRAQRAAIGKEMIAAAPRDKRAIEGRLLKLDKIYNEVAGKEVPMISDKWARRFDTVRNWLVTARLGSAVIPSLSDTATLQLTGRLNNLPAVQLMTNHLAALNIANKMEERLALRNGLGLDILLNSLNRYGQDSFGYSFSRKSASSSIRISSLAAWTTGVQRTYGTTMSSATGAVVRDHATLRDIDPDDHRMLLSKGITETDFAVWKKAELEDWGGGNDTMLTAGSIYRIPDAALKEFGDPVILREQAATKLLGMVLEETDMAVIVPGARERVQMGSQEPRGEMKGEIIRSFFQFKAYPIAMLERHWKRGMSIPNKGGKAAYVATLIATTTVIGMLALQVNEVLQGRDPRKMFGEGGPKTWLAAMLKGGSLGLYGDILFSGRATGESLLGYIAGPTIGLLQDTYDLTAGNLIQLAHDKETNFGTDAVKFFKTYVPFANLWYTKAAMDHLVYNRLLEYFSPGYISRMRNRAARDFGQHYWWEPGEPLPERAPDLEAAVGE